MDCDNGCTTLTLLKNHWIIYLKVDGFYDVNNTSIKLFLKIRMKIPSVTKRKIVTTVEKPDRHHLNQIIS